MWEIGLPFCPFYITSLAEAKVQDNIERPPGIGTAVKVRVPLR